MEGYLWIKGRGLFTMRQRYCVLHGTMLSSYATQDEYQRQATPRDVLEVTQVRDWDGKTALRQHQHAFVIDALIGASCHCHAEASDVKTKWMKALMHALDEPDRIVEDEVHEARRHLEQEQAHSTQAMTLAAEAVARAQQCAQEVATADRSIKQEQAQRQHNLVEMAQERILLEEAQRRADQTRLALDVARHKAHDAALRQPTDKSDAQQLKHDPNGDPLMERVATLAAQLEVDVAREQTHAHRVETLQAELTASAQRLQELAETTKVNATQSQQLRDAAAVSLEHARSSKQLSRLRVSSWTSVSSHLDALAEGYLMVRHPRRSSMHRRYYVLCGSTLCWYPNADAYANRMEAPSGVVHVRGVSDWEAGSKKTNKNKNKVLLGATTTTTPTTSTPPVHGFVVETVEGKTLYCAAPTRQSAAQWHSALHVALTMGPMSPHRARAAKARRDSFDLEMLAPTGATEGKPMVTRRASLSDVSMAETTVAHANEENNKGAVVKVEGKEKEKATQAEAPVVEGYLVQKNGQVSAMKKKYCVLRRLRFFVYDSHDEYALKREQDAGGTHSLTDHDKDGDHGRGMLVCGVSDWDGHSARLQYHHGFHLHTVHHGPVFCSAASEREREKWSLGVHAALLTHQDEVLSPSSREQALVANAQAELRLALASGDVSAAVDTKSAEVRFKARLRVYYEAHHASKVGDVPMLAQRYQGREQVLIAHLDRLYDTQLSQEPDIIALMTELEEERAQHTKDTKEDDAEDFVKMAGYLQWAEPDRCDSTGSVTDDRVYCVLTVNKLVRYRSQTHCEAEAYAPLDVLQVISVADGNEGKQETTSSTVGSSMFTVRFELCSGPNGDAKPSSRRAPSIALVTATSPDTKLLWMAKMHSGLGLAAAKQPGASDITDASSPSDFRRKLLEYYLHYNPKKVGDIDALLHYFTGRERELLVHLDATYGSTIQSDESFVSVLPPEREESPRHHHGGDEVEKMTAMHQQLHHEGYLWVKHAQLGAGFRKIYCVLRDETWSCFANHSDAHSMSVTEIPASSSAAVALSSSSSPHGGTVLISDVVTDLNANMTAKLQKLHVISITTPRYGVVLLRADAESLIHDWVRVLRKAVDLQQQLQEATDEAESELQTTADNREPIHSALHDKLVAFYRVHHPDKASEVRALLHAFRGRERDLLREIDCIYNSQLASDPSFIALLPSAEDGSHDKGEEDTDGEDVGDNSGILMEGYLVKRGHLVPTMHKRYCVLVENVLTYYATYDESRDSAHVKPHGQFTVEVVGHWNGQTSIHTFEHGLELETLDGATFFCAAPSAEAKAQWMHAFQHGIVLARQRLTQQQQQQQQDGEALEDDLTPLRAYLTRFYQAHNASKLDDVDLLLACYHGRERSLLEAIDATYGSALAQDAKVLAMLPAHETGDSELNHQKLRLLEHDGALRQATAHSDSEWKHAQRVYLVQRGLVLSFYSSHDQTRAVAVLAKPTSSATLLAVKALKDETTRFAIETADHTWIYLEAPSAEATTRWLQMLRAAVDSELARGILEEERVSVAKRDGAITRPAACRGFITIDMSFLSALAEYQRALSELASEMTATTGSEATGRTSVADPRQRATAWNDDVCGNTGHDSTRMQECFVELPRDRDNQLFIYETDAAEVSNASGNTCITPLAVVTVVATRAAAETAMLYDRWFPFELVTQEQVVLRCRASTDMDRARWLHHIRDGVERAAALEMLAEQRDDAQRAQQLLGAATDGDLADDGEMVEIAVSAHDERRGSAILDDASGHVRGYLLYAIEPNAAGSKASAAIGEAAILREGFVIVSNRADVSIFADEAASLLTISEPLLQGRAVELDTSGRSPLAMTRMMALPPASATNRAVSRLARFFGSGHRGHDDAMNADDNDEAREAGARNSGSGASEVAFRVEVERDNDPGCRILVAFVATSHEARGAWVAAFARGIDLLKGEQLLRDEATIRALEISGRLHEEPGTTMVGTHSSSKLTMAQAAMEGFLTPWQHQARGASHPNGASFFAVLVGCHLRGFPTREAAEEVGKHGLETTEKVSPSPEFEIVAIADWTPSPLQSGGDQPRSIDHDDCGFQVEARVAATVAVSATTTTWWFMAPCAASKRQWVHVVQHELAFVLAETYLDEDARAFARQAAEHVAVSAFISPTASVEGTATAAGGAGDAGGAGGITDQETKASEALSGARVSISARREAYMHVRHQCVSDPWSERFAVLVGATLFLFQEGADALEDDWAKRAIEQHEIISADLWTATATATASASNRHHHHQPNQARGSRHGLRVENAEGALLECTLSSAAERDDWLAAMQTGAERMRRASMATSSPRSASSRFVCRDPALPFVAGAAMEGYLQLREQMEATSSWLSLLARPSRRGRRRRQQQQWVTRYGVLLGTQWFLYESQEHAITLHNHQRQHHSSSRDADSDDANAPPPVSMPLAVYDVSNAIEWRPDKHADCHCDGEKEEEKEEQELLVHAFIVGVHNAAASAIDSTSTAGQDNSMLLDMVCRAHTSLERKRWLNAIEDEVRRALEQQAMVATALARRRDQEHAQHTVKTKFQALQLEANQQSAMLRGLIDSMAMGSDDSVMSSGTDDDDDDEDEDEDEDEDDAGGGGGDRTDSATAKPTREQSKPAPLSMATSSRFIARSPENSPMNRRRRLSTAGAAALRTLATTKFDDTLPSATSAASSAPWSLSWWPWPTVFSCCLARPPSTATATAMASVAPLTTPIHRYDAFHTDRPAKATMHLDW